ncbi:MAG TPA: DnaB-like helicase C-terminal domain-containing protein, partial [bacterium]|nr:DnaB-like helicase C-terminal domain-containing protein [bacterium]
MDYNPKLLPGNIEAEASLLGCLLINGKLFGTVEGTGISSEDFYEDRHSVIFKIIRSIYSEGKVPDVITVGNRISTVKGGNAGVEMKYLYELANSAPVVSESILEDYCSIIIEKSLYRELIRICSESVDSAYRQSAPFNEVVDKSTTDLITLSNRQQAGSVIEIKNIVDSEMQKLKERIDSGRKISGISSGYPVLDNFGSGFKPGDMIVLAGRPGMGKTSFALNMTIEIARLGHNVLFFSLEMPSSQLVQRIISIECSVNAKNLAIGKFDKDEITRLWAGVDKVSKLPIYVDETSKLTISDLRSKAKKLDAELRKAPPSPSRSNRLDCIFIDYLQLMSSTVYREDKVRQVEDISRNIKLFAKELGI